MCFFFLFSIVIFVQKFGPALAGPLPTALSFLIFSPGPGFYQLSVRPALRPDFTIEVERKM